MSSENEKQEDWFDRAEALLAERKARDVKGEYRYSARATRALDFATQAALWLGDEAVGAEHLLTGILKLNSGDGAAALGSAGLTLPMLREDIEAEKGISAAGKVTQRIPYTPRCKGIVARAMARARRLGDARVDVDDLLLELLAEKEGLPARIFRRRGINVEEIRRAIGSGGR